MNNKIKWALLFSLFIGLFAASANAISIKDVNQKFDTPKYRNLAVYSQRAILVDDIENENKVKVLVAFASWCPSCKDYMDELNKIAKNTDVEIYGVAVSDNPSAVRDLFNKVGNPFSFVSIDKKGKTLLQNSSSKSIPQTFLIDKKGNIRYTLLGDLDEKDWEDDLMPRYNELNRE